MNSIVQLEVPERASYISQALSIAFFFYPRQYTQNIEFLKSRLFYFLQMIKFLQVTMANFEVLWKGIEYCEQARNKWTDSEWLCETANSEVIDECNNKKTSKIV